jgi:hypothetical protein
MWDILGVYDHHGLSHPYSSSNVVGNNSGPQHRTHEGYLRKRGHLLKQWKERWFVLDSIRHEVIILFLSIWYLFIYLFLASILW